LSVDYGQSQDFRRQADDDRLLWLKSFSRWQQFVAETLNLAQQLRSTIHLVPAD